MRHGIRYLFAASLVLGVLAPVATAAPDLSGNWHVEGTANGKSYTGSVDAQRLFWWWWSSDDQGYWITGSFDLDEPVTFHTLGTVQGDTLTFTWTVERTGGIVTFLESSTSGEPDPAESSSRVTLRGQYTHRASGNTEHWTGGWSGGTLSAQETWSRPTVEPAITALEPASFEIPHPSTADEDELVIPGTDGSVVKTFKEVLIHGEALPAEVAIGDIRFTAEGVTVSKVYGTNADGTKIEVDLEVSSAAGPGRYDIIIGELAGTELLELTPPVVTCKLGGSVEQSGEGSLCKVYVPTKYPSHLLVTATSGTVTICYPDKETEVGSGSDVATSGAGWYFVRVDGGSGSYTVEANLEQRARATWVPYNFWYFPYYEGSSPPFGWDVAKAYDDWRDDGSTKAHDWEDEHHHTTEADTAWWGHCGAAAKASILFKQPPRMDNEKSELTEDQIEGLLSLYCRTHGQSQNMYWNSHTSSEGGTKPKEGEDANDQYADDFFESLRDMILVNKQVVLIDMEAYAGDTSLEKWNQGCYKYTARFVETENGTGEQDITMILTFVASVDNNTPNNGNPESGGSWTQVSKFRFIYGENGEIDGSASEQDYVGNWLDREGGNVLFAPGYTFKVLGAGRNWGGDGNPHISWEDLEKMGVEANPEFKGTE